jgi:hypothetical protein
MSLRSPGYWGYNLDLVIRAPVERATRQEMIGGRTEAEALCDPSVVDQW